MTHDELLNQLRETLVLEEMEQSVNFGEYSITQHAWKALIAIVELHKPSENYTGDACEYCFALAYEPSGLSMEYEDFAYPCPTIQAIEKELL